MCFVVIDYKQIISSSQANIAVVVVVVLIVVSVVLIRILALHSKEFNQISISIHFKLDKQQIVRSTSTYL